MSSGRPRRNSSRNSGRHIFDFISNKSNQSPSKVKNRSLRGLSIHKDSNSAVSLLPGVEIGEGSEENFMLSWDAILHVGCFLNHNDMLSLDLLCREFSRRTNEMWKRRAEEEGIAEYKFQGFKHHLRSFKLNFILTKRLLWFFCEIQSPSPCNSHNLSKDHLTCIAFTSKKSDKTYHATIMADISNNTNLEERFNRFARLQGRFNSHLNFHKSFDFLVNSNLQCLIPSNATCGLDISTPLANSKEIHSQILQMAVNSKAESGDVLLALCMELISANSNNSSLNFNNDNFTFLLAKSAVERGAHAAAIIYLRSRAPGLNGTHSKQIKNHMESLAILSATHNLNENHQKSKKSRISPVNLYIKLLVRNFSFAKAEKFLKKRWESITQSLLKGGDVDAWSLIATPYVTLAKLLLVNSTSVRDQNTCKELFEKAARLNNPKGQYRLALMLRKMSDETHTEDLGSARHWLSLAAGQGHHKSQRLLAWMLRSGEGGNTDLRSSRMWYQRAALSGDLLSLRAYAWMLYFGKGGNQDKSHATQLFRLASLRGDGESAYRYAWSMVPSEDAPETASSEEAAEIKKAFYRAATLGHKSGMAALGRILFTGETGSIDMTSARRWFTAASDKGDSISKCNLGWMMIAGEGGAVDLDGGSKLLSKGPDPNGEQFNMNSVSRGTSNSIVKSKALPHRTSSVLSRLADEGFLPAQYSLIWMLTDPSNNERDLMKAKVHLLKAMDQTKRDQRYLLDLLPKEEDSESNEEEGEKGLQRFESTSKKNNKNPKSPLVKTKSKSGKKSEK